MHRPTARRLRLAAPLLLALGVAGSAAAQTDPCPLGPSHPDVRAGDLGPAPAGAYDALFCLEVRNDRTHARSGELAFSGVPIAIADGLFDPSGLVVVGPGERRIAAELAVLSRWGSTVDDVTRPIRWLEVALQAEVAAESTARYALRHYASPPTPADPFAVTITQQGALLSVDTGVATFVLDPQNPALFDAISIAPGDDGVGRTPAYAHTPGAGPRLVFAAGNTPIALDTSLAGAVVVDPGGFEIVRSGPVRTVAVLRGHWVAPGGESLCLAGPSPYERFGYTLVATFTRGRRHVDLQLQVRNECSDAFSGPWTDDVVTVHEAAFVMPFATLANASLQSHFAGAGSVAASATGFSGVTEVAQRKGGGTPWARRAQISLDGAVQETAEAFDQPIVGVGDGSLLVSAQMPWMRFREPQALAVVGRSLSLRVIGEPLVVGEGKGIWSFARVGIAPAQVVAGAGGTGPYLEAVRRAGTSALERPLLVRAPRAQFDRAGHYPSLGTDQPSLVKTAYLAMMDALHEQTVSTDPAVGQWLRARTFGSQLWPDVQFDLWAVDGTSPDTNDGAMNYWNPSGAELFEFVRSGDPRWVWDFAMPQSWLQGFTAYLNIGARSHGNRAGFAVTSGGSGEGQWHRSAFGSDDYSYNRGLELAFAIRPNAALRDRFAQAGLTVVGRYAIPRQQEASREAFVNQVDITRQVIQHFEMLANCAEFVPAPTGRTCHDKLIELIVELAEDNLRAGIMCQGDVPSPTTCFTPQQFMQNALMYPFFHGIYRNYGDPSASGALARALVEAPLAAYTFGIEKQTDGVSPVVDGAWADGLACTLTGGGTAVVSCQASPNSDGNLTMYAPNRPHTNALLLASHELDPSNGLCEVARTAYGDPALTDGWFEFVGNDSGWWKGASQMMQGMVFGVGLNDTCLLPEPSGGLAAYSAVVTLHALRRGRASSPSRQGPRRQGPREC